MRDGLARVAGVDITADVAGRNVQEPRHADHQVGEILANAALIMQHDKRGRFERSAGRLLLKVGKKREIHVKKHFQQIVVIPKHEVLRIFLDFP